MKRAPKSASNPSKRGEHDEQALARSNPIPLYYQLATKLKEEIVSGALQPGARYYSDRELIRRYGVSLLTVRQAMSELVNERLLERRQGSGTFISSDVAKVRARERQLTPEAILFTGWSPAALTGWDAMYFRDIFEGIQAEATARNLRVMFDDIHATSGAAIKSEARKRGIRGALALLGSDVERRTAALAAAGLRVVTVNFRTGNIPAVMPDDYSGGLLATRHLISLGHRRMVHINSGERTSHWMNVRRAYNDAIVEAGLSISNNPVFDGHEGVEGVNQGGRIETGYALTARVWQRAPHPTGIVAGNDLMAIGALRFLHEHSVEIPRQVSVIGFDNIEAAEICTPTLTTIAVDRKAMGRRAVCELLDDNHAASDQDADLVGVKLIHRQTTAAPQSI